VELIVLNIGLQAGILNPRVFAMFVVEALVLTFMSTPLTLLFYPPSVRKLHSAAKSKAKGDDESPEKNKAVTNAKTGTGEDTVAMKLRITIMLHQLEHISPLMTMAQLLGPSVRPLIEASSATAIASGSASLTSDVQEIDTVSPPKVNTLGPTIDALRLMDLSERTSTVMYGSVTDELLRRDPLVAAMKTFSRLHRIPVSSTALSVTPHEEFSTKICQRAAEVRADLVLLPWNTTLHPVVEMASPNRHGESSGYNPFEGVFGKSSNPANLTSEKSAAVVYAQFVRKVFSMSTVDVALFIENDGSSDGMDESDDKAKPIVTGHHIFFPYFGGPDDRLALNFVIQLCGNGNGSVQATVVRMTKTEPDASIDVSKVATGEQNEHLNMLTAQSVGRISFDLFAG
jgi:hypothetical protein